jgi:hypothetical protein
MDTVTKIFKIKPPVQFKSAFKAVECSNKELVMGVELEVENTREIDHYTGGYLSGLWMFERDGSLRVGHGGEAYEFISKPVQMQFLLPELQKFFEYTKFDEENYSDRCSVHVHTNVTDFTQDMLASLSMVYTVVEDVLFQYANHYKAPTMDGYNRDTNLYCIPWNQCRMNHRLVEKLFGNSHAHLARWQKYTALNLLPITTQGTVEWRHMHGTADMEKLTTWLNLIGSIMWYARRTQLDDVIKTILTLNDTSAYRQFFLDVTKGYLEYKEEYQVPLAEGVINAKYGLFDWDRSKKPVEEKVATTANRLEEQFRVFREQAAAMDGAIDRVNPGRPAPRPAVRNPVRNQAARARPQPEQEIGGLRFDGAAVIDHIWPDPHGAVEGHAPIPGGWVWGGANGNGRLAEEARRFQAIYAEADPAPERADGEEERDEEEEF